MSLSALHLVLPEVGRAETKTVTFTRRDPSYPDIEPGHYSFIELFCTEEDCDCRRAMLKVVDDKGNLRATLNYGWESPSFYSDWMGGDDEYGKNTAGAGLYELQPQGRGYLQFAKVLQWMIKADPDYGPRIARHYKQFKDALAADPGKMARIMSEITGSSRPPNDRA